MASSPTTVPSADSPAAVEASPAQGFRSLEEEVVLDSLPVRGELPDWLGGALIRTGPAKFEFGETQLRHWFDGAAMLHRFGIADGRVSYANRFLETRAYKAARDTGEIAYSEFATDPCRSLFKKVTTMFDPEGAISDNCNVNLVQLGERFIAMTETPIPVQFDPDSLAAAGVAYKPPGMLTTAHPHLERASGGMLNYAAKLGPRNEYRFFHLPPDSKEPELLASIRVKEPAYMHSFGLTERWLVLAEFPFVVNPLKLAMSGRPYIENYEWKPELGTRLTLVDRKTGETAGPFETEARFGFHHVNAYEDGDQVVVDICTLRDASIVEQFYMEPLRAKAPIDQSALERFTISPATGEVEIRRLSEEPIELPRINYGRCNERPYRYAWGVGLDGTDWMDRIVKIDVESGDSLTWKQDAQYPGEPVFVAEPGASEEDRGVLLSVVLDGHRGTSFLLVLDAASLEELARAEVPHHIPFGFHGQFAPGLAV